MPTRLNERTERKSLTPFYGQVTDKNTSINRRPGHFDLLENCFSDLDEIKKRKGYSNYISAHTTGSRVYGQHYQFSSSDIEFSNVKIISGTNNLYFYDISGAQWSQFTGHTFPASDTYFVEMDGFDEWNGSIDISETVKSGSTATDVLLGSATGPWPDNYLVGHVARFTHSASNVEYKIIAGNYNDGTNDHILFNDDDPLNSDPATSVAIKIREKSNMLYIGGGNEYAVIGPGEVVDGLSGGSSSTGYRQLDGTSYAQDGFTGIELYANRAFGWKERRVSYSDLFNCHNFGKNAYFDFSTSVRRVKAFSDNVCIIYTATEIYALLGISPSNWELRLITSEFGTSYPKTVANYVSTSYVMQFFVSSDNHVRVITSDSFNAVSREAKVQSITMGYIHDSFSATSNFLCAGVDNEGKYTVFRSDNSINTLNVRASEKTRFREWIWSSGSTARTFYNATRIGGFLRLGDNANGQIYTWNDGTDDAGTDIAMTIRRRGLNFDALGDKTKFKHLDIAQGANGDSTTITVKAEANSSGTAGTIDHTLGTHDPSTGNKHRAYKIPNNPTNNEGSGHMIDYEITESSGDDIAPIEDICFRYRPSVLQ